MVSHTHTFSVAHVRSDPAGADAPTSLPGCARTCTDSVTKWRGGMLQRRALALKESAEGSFEAILSRGV